MFIPKALQMVLTDRIILDLRIKMRFITRIPQDKLTKFFFDLCDFGIQQYIISEQEKNPELTASSIMKRYYLDFKSGNREK